VFHEGWQEEDEGTGPNKDKDNCDGKDKGKG
jgi:hypothetical protein